MLTGLLPFHDINKFQIMDQVINGQRPLIPLYTPKNLRTLIESCWHANPKFRPEFDQIYEVFKSGGVRFGGTNSRKIRRMFDSIQKIEMNQFESSIPRPIIEVSSLTNSSQSRKKSVGSLPRNPNDLDVQPKKLRPPKIVPLKNSNLKNPSKNLKNIELKNHGDKKSSEDHKTILKPRSKSNGNIQIPQQVHD